MSTKCSATKHTFSCIIPLGDTQILDNQSETMIVQTIEVSLIKLSEISTIKLSETWTIKHSESLNIPYLLSETLNVQSFRNLDCTNFLKP